MGGEVVVGVRTSEMMEKKLSKVVGRGYMSLLVLLRVLRPDAEG